MAGTLLCFVLQMLIMKIPNGGSIPLQFGERISVVKMPYFPEYGREVMSDVIRIAICDGQHVNTEVVFR